MSFFDTQNPGFGGVDELTLAEQLVVQTITSLGTPGYFLRTNLAGDDIEWADIGGGGYTDLTQFVDQTAWRVFYSNTDGDVTELALGTSGTYLKSNGASSAPTWDTPGGSGDMLISVYDPNAVSGDAFDQDNMVDGTTNKNYTATEQTKLAGAEETSNKATDFSTVNDTLYPTVEAVSEYVANAVTGLLDYRGTYDASTNLYPATGGSGLAGAVLKGDFYIVSVAGTLGTTAVTAGDLVIALTDTPGQTAGNWDIISNEVGYAPENVANKVTSLSGASTDTQYPSAKLAYDQLALKAATGQTFYIGTTQVAINRASAALTLAGLTFTTPVLGTPTSGTLTNCTGLPASGLVASTSTDVGFGSINLGHASDTTISRIAAGIIAVEGEVLNGYATTATAAGTTTLTITAATTQYFTGTSTQTVKLPTTSVVVGQRYRVVNLSTGLVTVQSSGANTIVTLGLNQWAEFTALAATPTTAANWNYRKQNINANANGKRVVTVTQSATPAINTDNGDLFQITGLAQAITSMTSSLIGTPADGQIIEIEWTDSGTARAITFGASFGATTIALPTTTVISTRLRAIFQFNGSLWQCIGVA